MVMLMLFLLENNLTTAEFFEPVVYQQNVKSKSKQQTLDILKAEDFFRLLHEAGIREKATEHANLKQFLQLSPQFPDLLVLKSIRKTMEQMAENEEFMEAIREDIMQAQGE
jgi:threonine synthase